VDYTKRADRDKAREARQNEIAAIDGGWWPRDSNDRFRWGATKVFHSTKECAQYSRRMCLLEVDYLDGLDERIAAGEMPGWEA